MSGWIVLPAVLVLVLVGLISIPLTFQAGGCLGQDKRRLESKITWGWGLFTADVEMKGRGTSARFKLAGINLSASRKKDRADSAEEDKRTGRKPKQSKKQTGRNRSGFPPVIAVLNREMLAAVLGYLKKLYKSLGLRLRLSGVYGADDPAVTGFLAGLVAALRAGNINLDLDADFSGPFIDIIGETSGRIVPIAILWHSTCFLLAKPVRKLWWAVLKTKIKRKKIKESVQYV